MNLQYLPIALTLVIITSFILVAPLIKRKFVKADKFRQSLLQALVFQTKVISKPPQIMQMHVQQKPQPKPLLSFIDTSSLEFPPELVQPTTQPLFQLSPELERIDEEIEMEHPNQHLLAYFDCISLNELYDEFSKLKHTVFQLTQVNNDSNSISRLNANLSLFADRLSQIPTDPKLISLQCERDQLLDENKDLKRVLNAQIPLNASSTSPQVKTQPELEAKVIRLGQLNEEKEKTIKQLMREKLELKRDINLLEEKQHKQVQVLKKNLLDAKEGQKRLKSINRSVCSQLDESFTGGQHNTVSQSLCEKTIDEIVNDTGYTKLKSRAEHLQAQNEQLLKDKAEMQKTITESEKLREQLITRFQEKKETYEQKINTLGSSLTRSQEMVKKLYSKIKMSPHVPNRRSSDADEGASPTSMTISQLNIPITASQLNVE
ncbi:Hypothetical_protein [Hexamita inflata]|uniref:Hypothetical_protein n=1 Tax=Hexamita inflata TaxID=28002 RepID=A0AA86P0U3_9EUKA|nr:Hypothetical protein HINF_LOCUS17434 [Hexamita inflata]